MRTFGAGALTFKTNEKELSKSKPIVLEYQVTILQTHYFEGGVRTTFKYWVKGNCACEAKKATVETAERPTAQMLQEYAAEHFNK